MNARLSTLVAATGLCALAAFPAPASEPDPYAALPASLSVNGTLRDFKGRGENGGHTDFEWTPSSGYGHYMKQVANQLDQDGLPAFNSGGYKVAAQWRDASGRNVIGPRPYLSARPGDVNGSMSSRRAIRRIFFSWWR